MHSVVGKAFLVLMGAIIGAIFYFIFFGTVADVKSETYEIDGGWKGVIGVASDSIETSVARYYYNYCYLPTIQGNDGTDAMIGFNARIPNYSSEVESRGFSTTATKSTLGYSLGTFSSSMSGYSGIEVNYN